MNLSPHFTLQEMTVTGTGLENNPPAWAVEYMRHLCLEVLEPWRLELGVPLDIDSGFRSEAVNAAVKGAPKSQHRNGLAADAKPRGMDVVTAYGRLVKLAPRLPLGQGILYVHDRFVHVSMDLGQPRRELLVCADPTRQARLIPWATWMPDADHKPAPQAMTV